MARSVVTWATNRGRNTWDHPMEVPNDMSTESLNVELNSGELGAKRPGAVNVTLDTSAHAVPATTSGHLGRFVPAQDESAAELHVVFGDSTIWRFANGNVIPAASLVLVDAISTHPEQVVTVQLNNKLFYAFDSTVNRLHKYDPQIDTTNMRRTGLAAPTAAPTCADTGAGGPAATIRWYCQASRIKVGTKIISQSEFSPVVARTNTAGSQTRVTKASDIDACTHWVLAASATSVSGPFYEIAETLVATTTYDDAATPSTYSTLTAIPTVGSYYPFPSVKFLSTDGKHLFGLGVWESAAGASIAPVAGRLYFTPAIGSSTNPVTDDDERIQNTSGVGATSNWLDLNVGATGVDTGLSDWIQGVMFAFQSSAIYMITATNAARVPFRSVILTQKLGAICHTSIATGVDERGNPCVYFWSPQNGPNRITPGGEIQWLGKDLVDIVPLVNVSSVTNTPCVALYDPPNQQVKFWLAMNAETSPDGTAMVVFHTAFGHVESLDCVRGGWAKWTGNIAKVQHAIMFAKTFATATRPLQNVTYMASRVTNSPIMVQDGTATQDAGSTNYQAYVQSKAWDLQPIGRRKRIKETYVLAGTTSGVTIRHTVIKDFGTESFTNDILLTAAGSETYIRSDQALDVADCLTFQSRIGDSAAQNVALWTVERAQAVYDTMETS